MRFSGGDARKLLNILELVVESAGSDEVVITDKMVEEQLQQNPLAYDKQGDMHYDIISAFIKVYEAAILMQPYTGWHA